MQANKKAEEFDEDPVLLASLDRTDAKVAAYRALVKDGRRDVQRNDAKDRIAPRAPIGR